MEKVITQDDHYPIVAINDKVLKWIEADYVQFFDKNDIHNLIFNVVKEGYKVSFHIRGKEQYVRRLFDSKEEAIYFFKQISDWLYGVGIMKPIELQLLSRSHIKTPPTEKKWWQKLFN